MFLSPTMRRDATGCLPYNFYPRSEKSFSAKSTFDESSIGADHKVGLMKCTKRLNEFQFFFKPASLLNCLEVLDALLMACDREF